MRTTLRATYGTGLLLCVVLCGCQSIPGPGHPLASGWGNQSDSSRAWQARERVYSDIAHHDDFRQGFQDGYRAVAAGGTGYSPTLPPHKYWSVLTPTETDQQKATAWSHGYAHGALAARRVDTPREAQAIIPAAHETPAGPSGTAVGPAPADVPETAAPTAEPPFRSEPMSGGPATSPPVAPSIITTTALLR